MSGDGGVLVPIAPSATLEESVAYAVDVARQRSGEIHLVRTVAGHYIGEEGLEADRELLGRAEGWARMAADEGVAVRTQLLGTDRYIADSSGHIDEFVAYAREHGIDRVVLDPNYSVNATAPTLQSVEGLLEAAGIEYEHAQVSASGWRPDRPELIRGGIIFVLAFAFYVGLGGVDSFFNIWSGAVTGLIAAALLRNVAFERTPNVVAVLGVLGRGVLFVPYMTWEIIKANVQFAYIVLHPRLPIDPCLTRVESAVGDGLSVTSFANSITLTPGTMTIDANDNELLVHALTPGARDDMLEGVHERGVRFLFYGREGLELPGPGPRGDSEELILPTGALETDPTSEPGGGDTAGAGDSAGSKGSDANREKSPGGTDD